METHKTVTVETVSFRPEANPRQVWDMAAFVGRLARDIRDGEIAAGQLEDRCVLVADFLFSLVERDVKTCGLWGVEEE